MPKGVPHRDMRFDNAVALYLVLWPLEGREQAVEIVRHLTKRHGIRAVTQTLQADLARQASKGSSHER